MDNREIWKEVNWMDREKIVAILESYGFACYDKETTDELRAALVANIEDGTIDPNVLTD